jgi:predicted nucleic acid-binding protein
MNDNRVFIDTNIWIYGLVKSDDPAEKDKRMVSISLFEKLCSENEIVVSTQIVNECHWNLIRKFGYKDREVFMRIQENIMDICTVMNVTSRTYQHSLKIREQFNISFWDSLVVTSALEGDCFMLYTEDMQHGQKIGKMRVANPFIDIKHNNFK